MSWVTAIWSLIVSACLTLALVHGLVWWRRREAIANLLFAVTAVANAGLAAGELWLMRTDTAADYGFVVRLIHLPAWALIVSLVVFARMYLKAGRVWLAWTVCGMRTLSLALNFAFYPNLNYRQITSLNFVPFLGEKVAIPVAIPNPWMLVAQLSLLLLVVFVADAAVTAWRRGQRHQALLVGGSIVIFTLMASAQAVLFLWGVVTMPFAASPFYLCIILAMGFEASRELLRTAALADELLESEARFRTVADHAPVMIWMSGQDKLCNFFNKGWLDYTGRTLEQELGNGWAEGVHPEDFDRCLKIYTTSFEARREFTMQYRLRKRDGEYGWLLDTGVPRRAADGAFLGFIGSCMEITTQKEAEERLRLVVEASPSAMIMVDSEGHITLVNTQAEKVFDYTRAELIGRPVEILVPVPYRRKHPGHRHEYAGAPHPRAMGAGRDLFARRKDGSRVPVEIGLNPIQTPQGRFVLASIVDITERKHAERDALQHRNELAHLARVAMLGELSGSLAHELNQPLTAILSNAQAAQRFLGKANPNFAELQEILGDIVSENLRAGEVIRRLRLLLKKGEVQHQRLELNEVVEEVLKLLRSDLVNHHVIAETDLAEHLPEIWGDRIQLQQVLLNLVVNACDSMNSTGAAGRRLKLRTSAVEGGLVRVEVSDEGRGLGQDQIQKIFEPFFTTKPQGLGLGLSVCRTIISAHRGQIGARDNEAAGATFHFTIPTFSAQPKDGKSGADGAS